MQPKPFLFRIANINTAPENEVRPQSNQTTNAPPLTLSSIAARMSISALCVTEDPLTSMAAIASQMRLGAAIEESTQRDSRGTPEPVAVWEKPESPLTSAAPRTPTIKSESVSSRDEEEPPRSLKRKRQPVNILATPTSSARTTPAHSPNSVVSPSGSSDVSRKIRSLKYATSELETPMRSFC